MNTHIGVRYIYEDKTDSLPSFSEVDNHLVSATDFPNLPEPLLANLKQAVVNIDLDSADIIIAEISQYNHQLAKSIKNYMENFDYEKILHLISATQEEYK
jgi:hypothetical protein